MKEHKDPIPVALYARVSSDRQDVDLSVAAQLRALRDYANKNGYFVAREYVDEAESGRVANRPEFRKMIDEAQGADAPFKEILVWKFSRFTRKREHAVAFKSMLRRKGVRVVSITEHADDSPTGKLMEAIIESVDEFYSENLAQEVMRGLREAASRGFWITPNTPYGYRKVHVQDGAREAEVALSERRVQLDDVETIAAFAKDMSEYLNQSELTERRAFIESFVKEIVVGPDEARVRYSIPMPQDSRIEGMDAEEMAIPRPVLSTVNHGGPCSPRRFSSPTS